MTIELWHLVLLVLAVLGGYWALTKIIASQFQRSLDARFEGLAGVAKAQDKQLNQRLDVLDTAAKTDAGQWQRVERDLLKLQIDMPIQYVRREDYIRGQSVIEAKLDGLGSKLEAAQLRAITGGYPHASN